MILAQVLRRVEYDHYSSDTMKYRNSTPSPQLPDRGTASYPLPASEHVSLTVVSAAT